MSSAACRREGRERATASSCWARAAASSTSRARAPSSWLAGRRGDRRRRRGRYAKSRRRRGGRRRRCRPLPSARGATARRFGWNMSAERAGFMKGAGRRADDVEGRRQGRWRPLLSSRSRATTGCRRSSRPCAASCHPREAVRPSDAYVWELLQNGVDMERHRSCGAAAGARRPRQPRRAALHAAGRPRPLVGRPIHKIPFERRERAAVHRLHGHRFQGRLPAV